MPKKFFEKRRRFPVRFLATALSIVGVSMIISTTVGCKSWMPGYQVNQLRMENDRLLAEFRAQKALADKLAEERTSLMARLDESEKLLARSGAGSLGPRPSAKFTEAPFANAEPRNLKQSPAAASTVADRGPSNSRGPSSNSDDTEDLRWRAIGHVRSSDK